MERDRKAVLGRRARPGGEDLGHEVSRLRQKTKVKLEAGMSVVYSRKGGRRKYPEQLEKGSRCAGGGEAREFCRGKFSFFSYSE